MPSRLPQVMFFPYKPPPPEFWGVVLLAVAPPLVAWAIVRRRPGAARVALGAAGVVAAVVLLLWRGTDFVWQGGIFSWYYVPPALIWLVLLLPAPPGPAPAGAGLYTRFLLIAAAFGMLQLYPLMDRVHGAWSYPFTLPLLAVVLERGAAWFRIAAARAPVHRTAARLLPLTLLGLPLLWLVFGATWRLGLWWDVPASLATARPVASDWRPLALPHASLIAPGPMVTTYQGVVAYVDAHTAPGEPIYAFPNEQAFYAMAERPRGSTHSYLLPGVTSVAEQRAVIADLSAGPVRTLIVYVPATSLGSLAPLADWIAANYHTVATFGTAPDVYGVMEHN